MSFYRDNFDGKKVIKLEYEAYTPMAKKKLKELCNRLRVKWPDLYHIAMYHRHSTYIRTVRQGSTGSRFLVKICSRNCILLPKLFWPTVRKSRSSDQNKLLKFEAEGREFAKI